MKLWNRYLKAHTKQTFVFFLFCAIFFLSFALYHLPLAAVLYPTAICTVLGLAVLLLDFISFFARHKELLALYSEVAVTVKRLPRVSNLLEEDYQQIILSLFQEKVNLENRMQSQYTDLIEYYTVWAHQIKTPIASMYLSLQDDDSPFSRELTEELQHIEQYVEMVLCYLRLDSCSTDYLIRSCDLDPILRQSVRKFASQFIRRKIRLVYEPTEFSALTDEKWLLFVLEQLLSNAIKYTKAGGTISITMNEPGILCISDSGIGIAPEDLPRIFEKGYTGYNGRGDKKASGIGLYLCRRICGNLRHRITAESALGRGTVITLDLNRTTLERE
ncbi:sensor histidine kinase [Faecalispora anaeroviscerum]|uniref:sensor histidine kinase n=1 Tax=Faecalispora anaeroviscerum TaxID=2991836 RepID=UPI0024BA5539|nr:sensor histidine kinase [Faecalispora anaeroviscerum]